MTLIEAAKQALDTLVFVSSLYTDGTDPILCKPIDNLRQAIAEVEKQEAVFIKEPTYHDEAMGCGLEDKGIRDRYEAMRHGWDCAVSRILEQIPDEPLYTRPQQPKEWVGLTDQDAETVVAAWFSKPLASSFDLVKETEAALIAKNGGQL